MTIQHRTITDPQIHEPKGVAAAASGEVYVANGAGSGAWAAGISGQQVQIGYATSGTQIQASTTIPLDDTIPQNTEGTELITLAFTPKSASSTLIIEGFCFYSSTQTGTLALFVDSTADALAATAADAGSNTATDISVKHSVASGSTSARTYKLRLGTSGGAEWEVNGVNGSQVFGGTACLVLKVTEVL